MGIEFTWANFTRREYIDNRATGDNGKYPVNGSAEVLFEMYRHCGWSGEDVRLVSDGDDLPWASYMTGHEDWTEVGHEHFDARATERAWFTVDGMNGYVRVQGSTREKIEARAHVVAMARILRSIRRPDR